MEQLLTALIAFIIGGIVSFFELVTSKYPRTIFLLLKSKKLWLYVLIYGTISFCIMLLFDFLVAKEIITIKGLESGENNLLKAFWLKALIVGVSTKAFLHIRIFSANVGSQSIPIGIETIVQIFEPWLLQEIELDEFNLIRDYIEPTKHQYTENNENQNNNLQIVKDKILENLPRKFRGNERDGFIRDLDKINTVSEAMELYLTTFGKSNFERTFRLH
jgi:hypothetical protein